MEAPPSPPSSHHPGQGDSHTIARASAASVSYASAPSPGAHPDLDPPRGPDRPDTVARAAAPLGAFLSLNQSLAGLPAEELLTLTIPEFVETYLTPESRPVFVRKCERMEEEKSRSSWFRVGIKIPGDEHVRYYDTLLLPVLEQGRLSELQIVFREVTEQVRLEARLVDIEKMESLGRLAGCIAHDFNNLLVGILGSTSLALQKLDSQHPVRDLLNTISNCADRGVELTKQLLSLTRPQSTQKEPHDVAVAIESVMDILRRTIPKNIEIEWHKPLQGPIWVEMVRAQFERILLNLALNARDAMKDGGTLQIRVRMTYRSGILVSDQPAKSVPYVLIEISDTGEGMDPETQKHIFEPFFTTKPPGKGTGLGLASSYTLVKNMNGDIEFHSARGEGTTFRIFLPLGAPPKPAAPATAPPEPILPSAGQGVLLVDDEHYILEAACAILETAGYRAFEAQNSEQAQQVLAAHGDAIDLAVVDLTMPRISGARLARILKEMQPGLKILVSSGYDLETELAPEDKRYIDGTLPKPYRVKDLVRAIQKVLQIEA
ncbi:MAG: response regulator [Verrucomicrobiae bacterium]|nr:response regulator [Verrucomicrobiae bacterium]